MGVPVFLSYPNPFLHRQDEFIQALRVDLIRRGLEPRTLGVDEFDLAAPLTAIRRMMRESSGVITIALRRARVAAGTGRPGADNGSSEYDLGDSWLTSPWAHIEPAMAFQLGLPLLILRERGVLADGMLERGITGIYLPEFDLEGGSTTYLESPECRQLVSTWEAQVRRVVDGKGRPPRLY